MVMSVWMPREAGGSIDPLFVQRMTGYYGPFSQWYTPWKQRSYPSPPCHYCHGYHHHDNTYNSWSSTEEGEGEEGDIHHKRRKLTHTIVLSSAINKTDTDSELIDLSHQDSHDSLDENSSADIQTWLPALNLNSEDRRDLSESRPLNDNHINAASRLLSRAFPDIRGFQDPLLSQTGQFVPCSVGNDSMQIHHTRDSHWIVSACIDGQVFVFDSIYHTVSPDLKSQLDQIYIDAPRDAEGDICFLQPRIHTQRGSSDCGLYAIAIAQALCQGYDVSQMLFKQSLMRTHLERCFAKGKLTVFPYALD